MQTNLPQAFKETRHGKRADEILRSCVHCGLCNATCPTYQVLGDELDGPRGRIYLIKEMLEAQEADAVVQTHLDRCLTCRACEPACPSGVAYGELLEIGRDFLEEHGRRGLIDSIMRRWLVSVVPDVARFKRWSRLGRPFRWMLPRSVREQLPRRNPATRQAFDARERQVLVLQGCVQRAITPEVNTSLAALLDSRGIEVVYDDEESCCGSLSLHLGNASETRIALHRNIDALLPMLDDVEAVISTASGCGVTLKDYPRLLAGDESYFPMACRVAEKVVDVSEYLSQLGLEWDKTADYQRVAWHAPCTLQHGQGITGTVERLLRDAGYELVGVRDPHICCGSAGTYSLLQPELARTLRSQKLEALCEEAPDVIATANVGCQTHLANGDKNVPVVHWLELLR
ncbi:MAG: glycolate oxidase subunit GlcF [Gammaproteobacteria bacterium]|nr:MAG: glycolate oxidase subunit GlcF [Gammaproteobacteria bacterium]